MPERDQAGRRKSRPFRHQLRQRSHEQRRSDDQDQRECNLNRDNGLSQPDAARCGAASLPQRRDQRRAAGLQRRRKAAQDTAATLTSKREQQQTRVDRGRATRSPRRRAAEMRSEPASQAERAPRRAFRRSARAGRCRRETAGRSVPREAPSANRVLISRSRADPRARNRPATFKQARPNNTAVAANSTQSGCDSLRRRLEWPCGAGVSSSVEARNRCRRSAVILGNPARRVSSSSIALNHGCSPACACASVTSGLQAAQHLHPARAAVQQVRETREWPAPTSRRESRATEPRPHRCRGTPARRRR